jgi:hypothetical protein
VAISTLWPRRSKRLIKLPFLLVVEAAPFTPFPSDASINLLGLVCISVVHLAAHGVGIHIRGIVSLHELWSAWPRSIPGELHRNSGLITIFSQSKVNIFNFVENAVMSVEQIVRSSVRRNGTHR